MTRPPATPTGFTLIELLTVISIIGLLASVVFASLTSARAKARFAQVIEQTQQIGRAAEVTNNGSYASDASPGVLPPSFSPVLSVWPTPPCSGWTYDWENWSSGNTVRVSVRDGSGAAIAQQCIFTTAANCAVGYDAAPDITQYTPKLFTCNE